jgi:multidrug efflux pump subunit AcrA (membrane-fusion protein)
MKILRKLLIWVPLVGLGVLGYLYLRGLRMQIGVLQPETAVVRRGDLTIPITAAGKVNPLSRREIKAEASGEVEAVLANAGDMVRAGDLLIRLKRDDEERLVRRAEEELNSARLRLAAAETTLQIKKEAALPAAQARVDALKARMIQVEEEWRFKSGLHERQETTELEYFRAKATYEEMLAQIEQAEADVRQAQMAVTLSESDVKLAEAAVETSKTTLGDAEKRLEKTDIKAPVDGLVSQILVEEGEVIQGGKTTITGGTVLAVLADWSVCYVRAEVDEADIGEVIELAPVSARPGDRVGMPATAPAEPTTRPAPIEAASDVKITVEAFHDEEFRGRIERIYPEPKSASSIITYLVDIEVTSDNRHLLMSSMQADVEFTAKSVYDALLVPHEAIKRGPENELGVYKAVDSPNEKKPQPEFARCRIGLDNGTFAQVLEGVSEGDVVYTKLPEKTEREREEEENR